MIKRTLDLTKFRHSLFLFGPRQVGKTYLIKHTLSPDIYIDLLNQGEFLRYSKDVSILSKEVAAVVKERCLIVIDEIQRCPDLLNEIQILIENRPGAQFILTGSSARKLKRTGVNLLGGRAITLHLHPLTYEELRTGFSLEETLHFGTLPSIYLEKGREDKVRLLRSYVETYLKEEIQQESLTRNIPAFARFIELAGYENGNILNFQNIARETGVHSKTIKEYFHILEDTLLGFLFNPFTKSHRRRIVTHPKFYFFDLGVVSAIRGELLRELIPGTPIFRKAFEHYIIVEIKRLIDYREREVKMNYFRTTDGAEVDLILDLGPNIWAIEIKASQQPSISDLRGLRSFMKDHKVSRALCVCLTPRTFKNEGIEFLSWKDFLAQI